MRRERLERHAESLKQTCVGVLLGDGDDVHILVSNVHVRVVVDVSDWCCTAAGAGVN
jgi:hypothetical protein